MKCVIHVLEEDCGTERDSTRSINIIMVIVIINIIITTAPPLRSGGVDTKDKVGGRPVAQDINTNGTKSVCVALSTVSGPLQSPPA